MKRKSVLSKTSRQLAILHMFLYCRVLELVEAINITKVSGKTISRDIQELQRAGLINVVFSKEEKGYIHVDDNSRCPMKSPVFSENKATNRHLEKLIRLATIMINLRGHIELPYYDELSTGQKTCTNWYKQKFPYMSLRTMQRDFAELNKIGYEIKYDHYEKIYIVEFPEGLEEIEYRLNQIYRRVRSRIIRYSY